MDATARKKDPRNIVVIVCMTLGVIVFILKDLEHLSQEFLSTILCLLLSIVTATDTAYALKTKRVYSAGLAIEKQEQPVFFNVLTTITALLFLLCLSATAYYANQI